MDVQKYLNRVELQLFAAVKNGDIERVKMYVENGADLDAIDEDGLTLLSLATIHGRAEVADYIFECTEVE